MQENEKYGIELEAKTNLFKKGLQEAIKYTKAFGQGVKESFNEQITKSVSGWKQAFKEMFTNYDKELEKVRLQKKDIAGKMADYWLGNKEIDIKDLESQYKELQKKENELIEGQKKYKEEIEETNDTANKSKSVLSSLFDNSIGKIKRFTYYLLGARSVFSLFMKYRSAYYQFNEEMQYQSELSTNALALSLGPAFEFLGNVIAYASIGLAKFIELLTGVNVLSKVTTKGIKNYNKSLKETQTLVTGIDEITNLTNPQNLGLADQYKALDDFRKKIQEVEEFFAKNTWITDLIEGLKKVWKFLTETLIPKVGEFIESIGGAQGALILLGGVKVMSSLGKLIGKAGVGATAGTGLAGIAGLLTFIAGVHLITLTLKAGKQLDEDQETRQNIKTSASDYEKVVEQIKTATDKLKTMKKGTSEYNETLKYINDRWDIINGDIQLGQDNILDTTDDVQDLAKELDKITDSNYYTKTFDISKTIGLDVLEDKTKSGLQVLADGLTGVDEKNKLRHKAYRELIEETKNNGTSAIDEIKGKLGDVETRLKNIIKKEYKLKINAEIITKVGEGAKAGGQALSEAIAKAIRGYASGLDYVPYDNYPALLHKGEAVVPAKYNPTIHSQGNEYTNSLLETLIYKVEDLANRPNVFEIDGQQFARATYGLYDNERRSQNYVEGVVR